MASVKYYRDVFREEGGEEDYEKSVGIFEPVIFKVTEG